MLSHGTLPPRWPRPFLRLDARAARIQAKGRQQPIEAIQTLSNPPGWTPATDDDLSQYARECAAADVGRCNACFSGPALAQCSSFLCMKDVGKLLARAQALQDERDEFERKWLKASRDLAALIQRLDKLTGMDHRGQG